MAFKYRKRIAIRRCVSRFVALCLLLGLAFWVYYTQYLDRNLSLAAASPVPAKDVSSDTAAPTTARSAPAEQLYVEESAPFVDSKLPQQAQPTVQWAPFFDSELPQQAQPTVQIPTKTAGEMPLLLLPTTTPEIGARKDATGSIPVALRDMSVEEWKRIEAQHAPAAKKKLEQGSQTGAKQGKGGVFGAVDIALPLRYPILQYALGAGGGQASKNIVGLKRLSRLAKGRQRKCIVYGMGIAEESGFEEMMARAGCETHAFDCTVDHEAEAVYDKGFVFHQWCIGEKPAATQSSGDNTYSNSATVRLEGKLPCEDDCNIEVKIVSGGKGGGGNRADFYIAGKKLKFNAARGMNVVTVDPVTHEVLTKETYDVFEKRHEDNIRLAWDLHNFPAGRIVLMAVMDTGLNDLQFETKRAMQTCGATLVDGGFRESYAFIGRKSYKKVAESRSRDMPGRLVFKTLAQTMKELGHTYLDLLKFDIEGFEWKLFASEILTKEREQLPEQISFELHTGKANPAFVPQEVVKGKGYKAVNKLMLDLFNAGYRITSKEVNNGDPACAEFVALNVQ